MVTHQLPKPAIRAHGFSGERHFVAPPDVVRAAARHALLRDLCVTAAGHFPQAAGHLVSRPAGVPDEIVILCVQGSGWCRFGGRHWRIRAGDLVRVPPRMAHAYGTTKRQPWSIYWMHLAGARATEHLRLLALSPEQPVLAMGGPGELTAHFEILLDHLRLGFSPGHYLAGATAAAHLLALLGLQRASPRPDGQSAHERVLSTVEYMRQHLAQPMRVADLAARAGLSSPHYSWRFRRAFGRPPLAFLLRLRVQEASRLLATTDRPVRDVAAAAGFPDPLYFSRAFKRVAGCAPRPYRLRHRATGGAG